MSPTCVEVLWPFVTKSLPELPQNLHKVLFVDCLAREHPVDVDDAHAVKKGIITSGLAFAWPPSSGELVMMLSLVVVSLDLAFVTGPQRLKYSWIGSNEPNHLPTVTFLLFTTEHLGK